MRFKGDQVSIVFDPATAQADQALKDAAAKLQGSAQRDLENSSVTIVTVDKAEEQLGHEAYL